MKELIEKIKQKRELRGLPDEFIAEHLNKVMRQNSFVYPFARRDEKLLVKSVRARLRRYVGQFQPRTSRGDKLTSHISSRERLISYSFLKELVNTQKPNSILDLGCGLNPLALAKPDVNYYAYDINKNDVEEVSYFFSRHNIKGEAKVADIQVKEFPTADLCLMLKILDLLDTKGHKQAEILIRRVPSKIIIASFSTKTLSGRPMRHPQRGWIERLLRRLGYNFSSHKTLNEIFYVIRKQSPQR